MKIEQNQDIPGDAWTISANYCTLATSNKFYKMYFYLSALGTK